MKKHFVWTRDIQRVIQEMPFNKSGSLELNSAGIIKVFAGIAQASEHYYSFAATKYELSRSWRNINKSSVYRILERNQHLWEGVGSIFDAFELQKVLAAPPRSIIIPKFGIGGYGFEVVKPTDPNYSETWLRLPGAT